MSVSQQNPGSISLLCVDDDIWVLETLKHYFEHEPGIVLQTSSSAMEALDLLNSQHFDAIMCDYSMPDLNGVALLREIRSRGDNAIFIIFTGRRLANVAIETLNSGGNYYLQKGVDVLHEMPKVVGYIKSHLNSERMASVHPPTESPYHTLVENQLDPVCCFDTDGKFRYTNQSFKRDILSQKPGAESTGFFETIPEDERGEIFKKLSSLSVKNPRMHIEHNISTQDGSSALYLWNYRALTDESGEVTGYSAQGINFSEIVRLFSGPGLTKVPSLPLLNISWIRSAALTKTGSSGTPTSRSKGIFFLKNRVQKAPGFLGPFLRMSGMKSSLHLPYCPQRTPARESSIHP
jgi:PAS domain S-box-containing protein